MQTSLVLISQKQDLKEQNFAALLSKQQLFDMLT